MKKAAIIALIILTITAVGGLFVSNIVNSQPDNPPSLSNPIADNTNTQPSSAPTIIPEIFIEEPVTVTIPALNITAAIEHVGLDEKKGMDIPKDYNNAAWYIYGAKPGQTGSAVLAGHFDTPTGNPAIFYYLDKLKAGDEIIISDKDKTTVIFEVEETVIHKDATFPIDRVFLQNDKKRLNLITCYGSWNADESNYSDRLVVYTVQKEL